MKTQFTKLITLLLCLLCFGISSFAQDLTGTWRLKNLKTTKGAEYANALPKQMVINQTPNGFEFKLTNNLGDRDTVISQLLNFNSINESKTQSGKKKLISIQKKADGSWLKHSKVFSKDDPKELLSTDDESYTVDKEGRLTLLRVYDSTDEVKTGIQDYTAEASYEKLDPESAAREAAKGKGVNFVQGLNWEQIKAKAKAENKYIFVDCYATWCGPCKVMDKDVYPLNSIGEAMNDRFISVKVQMDSTKNDSQNVRLLYATARELEKKYDITGLPSYLFFNPSGEIVHKDMGSKSSAEFLGMINDAQSPQKQIFTLIKSCREGKMDFNLLPDFIQRLRRAGDEAIALELARIYIKNYLETLPESRFLSNENLDFMYSNRKMLKSTDRIFSFYYKNPGTVDSIRKYPGHAEMMIQNIFFYEDIIPLLDTAYKYKRKPDWNALKQILIQKSDLKLAESLMLDAKLRWYITLKDWTNVSDLEFQKAIQTDISKMQSDDHRIFWLNATAWGIFERSFNKKHLEKAVKWVSYAIELTEKMELAGPALLDTKANLLYKLGRKEEAIALQEKAAKLTLSSSIKARVDKMKRGEPTWEFGAKENKKVK